MRLSLLSALSFAAALAAEGQGAAFMYQGQLNANGAQANGLFDLTFALFATNTGGAAVAGPITNAATSVSNGLFTVSVDFGPGIFTGSAYWLEISASANNANDFVTLAPRQQITPSPYALYAPSAGVAQTAAAAITIAAGGSVPVAALPGAVLTNGASAVNLSGVFVGDGSGLTNVAAATLAATGTASAGTALMGSYTWAAMTNLTAMPPLNISGGVVSLPDSLVTLNTNDGGALTNLSIPMTNYTGTTGNPGIYPLTNTLGQVWISNYVIYSTNGLSAESSLTNGAAAGQSLQFDGTSLAWGAMTNLTAAPPLAISSGVVSLPDNLVTLNTNDGGGLTNLQAANLVGTVSNPISSSGAITANSFSGNGGGLTNLPAAALAGTLLQSSLGATNSYTPTIGNGTAKFTTSVSQGYYAIVGNLVYFEAWIEWTSLGSVSSGNLSISLPPVPVVSQRPVFNLGFAQGIPNNGTQLVVTGSVGTTNISLWALYSNGSAPTIVTATSCSSSGGQIQLSGTYRWQ